MRTMISFVVVLASACGGTRAPSPADDYIKATAEVAALLCESIDRCCTADERSPLATTLGFTTPAECATAFVAAASAVENEIQSGAVGVDHAALDACLAEARRPGCIGLASLQATCARALIGQLANDAACTDDHECVSGWCRAGATEARACARVPALGQPCTERCPTGTYCRHDATSDTCSVVLADGAGCSLDEDCASGTCRDADPATNRLGTCDAGATCDGV